MTSSDITLIKDSFRRLVPIGDQAAVLFYARRFELDPGLRRLFRGANMNEQGRKLMMVLATSVASLERLEIIGPTVRALGVRHVGYGVTEEHYAVVGAALLWMLEKGLGADFTVPVREAWTSMYSLLANMLIEAQREALAA